MPNALMAPLQSPHTPPQPPVNPTPQAAPSVGGAAAGASSASISPGDIEQAHKHIGVLIEGLLKLVNEPAGKLTKQSVFSEAADMIAKGAFPDQASKGQLVAEMAKLPDDEPALRKALGQFLLSAASNQNKLHSAFGPPGGMNGA